VVVVMVFKPPLERKRPEHTPGEKVATVLQNLRRLLPILWRVSPDLLVLDALLHLPQAIVPALHLYLTKELVDAVALAIGAGSEQLWPALRILALQVGLTFLTAFFRYLQNLTSTALRHRASFHLDSLVAAKAARVPLTYFDRPDYYDQRQRAQSGMGFRTLALAGGALQLAQAIVTVLAYILILARFHWALAAGMLLAAAPSFFVYLRTGEWRFWQFRRQTETARRAGYVLGLLTGREASSEVRLFGLGAHLTELWRRLFWKNASEQIALERKAGFWRFLAEGSGALVAGGAVAFLLRLGAEGALTLGAYVALAQALLSAQSMMQMVAFQLSSLYENALFTSDLFAFLDLADEASPAEPAPFPAPLRHGIAVESLSFTYPGRSEPALRGISLQIRPGEKVAIVGENGAGKTTLVKCLLGLYRAESGTIRYDGIPVEYLDPAELRRRVTAVFQDFVRYQLTARENIGFGRVERLTDEEALQDAAVRGGADEVIATLPNGLDTGLGPMFAGSRELSYGQWQKFALSRAFFRDAEVIVLDEPTAALDPKAEAAVFERFARLAAGKTALLISHRLGTCRSADRILVLRDGELAEEGSHEELLAQEGEYARMFRLQARWYGEDPQAGRPAERRWRGLGEWGFGRREE
jgi:ATP-binding cassette, subfamily B, bacterial